jgi:gliding motility-associated-like protein
MKKIVTILLFIVFGSIGYSQTYNMSNGGSVSTCSGTFYDEGGALANYSDNSNQIYTICSNNPAFKLEMTFTVFDLEGGFFFAADEFIVYDGSSTASTVIGVFTDNDLLGEVIYASGSCLTFEFISDGGITYDGWAATISCKAPCQTINAQIIAVTPTPVGANNNIKVCLGDQITLDGNATFPQNGTYYNQTLANSTFKWFVGGGVVKIGQSSSQTYLIPSINSVALVVEDINGCTDTIKAGIAIVGLPPSFASTTFTDNDTICLDDSVTISVSSIPTPVTIPPFGVAGVTFLPDGTGQSYSSPFPVNLFDPTAIYQPGFLDNVFIEMEHSYLGDLEMEIICPNGQSAILKSYGAGGSDTHLGEPIDQGTSTAPGVGYMYKFTTKGPTYGTMSAEAGVYQYTYTDVIGNVYTNQDYLQIGSYKPFESFDSQLIGCPLNGIWEIKVTDNLASDDGYIFQWGLNFNKLVLPDTSGNYILPQIVTKSWNVNPTIVGTPNDSTIIVSPLTAGDYSYVFNIIDDYGCTHDTTLSIHVKNRATSNAGIDVISCNLAYQLNPVPTVGASGTVWNYFSNFGTGTTTFSDPTIVTPIATVDEYSLFEFILTETVNGCETYPDTVQINYVRLMNTIDISQSDDTVCIPELVTFTNNSDMTMFNEVLWEFGDGSTSANINNATHNYANGCFDLKITLSNSQGCQVDSVFPNYVCAFNTPIANFNFSPYQPIVPETNVEFINTSSGNLLDFWNFDGLGTSINSNPIFTFPNSEAGEYPVELIIENIAGCRDTIVRTVIIKNTLSIFIPSSFTPNGDGVNDYFEVILSNSAVEDYSLRVFNRWGKTLFYTEDPYLKWDGTIDGTKLPGGVYVYELRGREKFDPDAFRKIGNITIFK